MLVRINGADPRMWDKIKKHLMLNSSKMKRPQKVRPKNLTFWGRFSIQRNGTKSNLYIREKQSANLGKSR